MGRYRKIDVRIWNDEKFRTLSDKGKLLFLFLLTHPHLTPVGTLRITKEGMAAELSWELKGFDIPFLELFRKGLIKYDHEAACVVVPNFLKYNPPENPNVVKSWEKVIDLIPECRLKVELFQYITDWIKGFPEPFRKAMPNPYPKGMPNQEPEPEQEQEQEQELKDKNIPLSPPKKTKTPKKEPTSLPADFGISDAVKKWATEKGYWMLEEHLEAFIDYAKARGKEYVDWDAAFRKAIREDWAKIRQAGPLAPGGFKQPKAMSAIIESAKRREEKKSG